ncbi:MAG: hypothetical protein VX535_06265, partial [Pseudomonadota bacterium]|nr:hypothetical protein [Pseudomonadota bacterium]
MKMGLQFITPLWFAATGVFLGALCLFAFLALKGGVRLPGRGEISILVFTIPLWVAPIAFFALGERLTRMNLVGL